MTLTQLITTFQNQTGRLDLSTDEIVALLNRASMFLDQLDTSNASHVRYYQLLSAGDYIVTLPHTTRWIQNVNAVSHQVSPKTQTPLGRTNSQDIRKLIWETGDGGAPLCYARLNSRIVDNPTGADLDFTFDTDSITLDPASITTYLLIYPIPQVDINIEVDAVFYSPFMSLDISAPVPENRWSILFPDLIIQASEYLLTKNLLNITESTKIYQDFKNSVELIAYDTYSDENISQMEG